MARKEHPMTNGDTALAVVSLEEYQALQNETEELRELVSEYLSDGLSADDLHLVKIPGAGGRSWDLPSGESAQSFIGIILGIQNSRLYYQDKFTGGGAPPNCSSRDGITGVGDPGGLCVSCPKAQWGSASTGKGQACSQRKTLYVLRPDDVLPVRLQLPATSFKNLRKLEMELLNKRLRRSAAAVKFGLLKTKNKAGIEYSEAIFTLEGALTPEIAQRARTYSALINASLSGKPMEDEHAIGGNPDLDEGDVNFPWEKGPEKHDSLS